MAMLAYLDAGTGSLIATVVVGGTAAAGVAVRSARAKMTGALTRKRKADAADVSEGRADATAPEAGATPTNG
jgi:hypothetical protein